MDITDILDSELSFEKSSIAIVGPGPDLDDSSIFYYLSRINDGKIYIVDKEDSTPVTNGFGDFKRFKKLLNQFLAETNLYFCKNINYFSSDAENIDKISEDNKPDIISYRNIFSYMDEKSIEKSVKSAFNALKPNGKIVVMARESHFSYDCLKNLLCSCNLKEYDIKDKETYRVNTDLIPDVPEFDSFSGNFTPYCRIFSDKANFEVIFEPKFLTDKLLIAHKNQD